jgi:negative regulator of flagellin synthesis FlgM
MKIWGEVPKVSGIYDTNKSVKRAEGSGSIASKKDVVSISGPAKDYQTVIKALKDVPDIRTDKVDELSDKYDAGSYDINGNDTADKILKSMIDSRM